jgi:uncharacterized DUF497 family protein
MTSKRSFVWDPLKAQINIARHGVSLESGSRAFDDPFAIEWVDERRDYGERRLVTTGVIDDRLVTVVHVERNGSTRIISVRPAAKSERDDYRRNRTFP